MSDDRKVTAAMLARLSNDDLTAVVLPELERRQLDVDGNPTAPPGRLIAAQTLILALLDQQTSVTIHAGSKGIVVDDAEARHTAAMLERLDAVGNGARVQTKGQDTVNKIREIEPLIEVFARKAVTDADAEMLAKTFGVRFGRHCDVGTVKAALGRDTRNGRVADFVIALGIIDVDDETGRGRNEVLRRVALALE